MSFFFTFLDLHFEKPTSSTLAKLNLKIAHNWLSSNKYSFLKDLRCFDGNNEHTKKVRSNKLGCRLFSPSNPYETLY